METTDQQKPMKPTIPRWRRIINGLLFGAMVGAILAIGITTMILGPSCYLDDKPSSLGGTQGSMAVLFSSVWGAIGAVLGAAFGAIISLPNKLSGRLITAGIIVVVTAIILFVINTTRFF